MGKSIYLTLALSLAAVTAAAQQISRTDSLDMQSTHPIDEVVVTAQRRSAESGSAYAIDRQTLEHAQMLNINHIATLLPGGKTVGDQNLASG